MSHRDIMLLRCCILLLYQTGDLWAQSFEFIYLTWVELRGFEPLTEVVPAFVELESGGPSPGAFRMVGHG